MAPIELYSIIFWAGKGTCTSKEVNIQLQNSLFHNSRIHNLTFPQKYGSKD